MRLDSPQAHLGSRQTLETPEQSRTAKASYFTPPGQANTSKMSLPGLDLSAPIETVATPTVYELKEQTEWRFEVAFGTKVEVRVQSPSSSALFYSLSLKILTRICSSSQVLLSFLVPSCLSNRPTPSQVSKPPSTPGMAVASRSSATAKSITLPKRPP